MSSLRVVFLALLLAPLLIGSAALNQPVNATHESDEVVDSTHTPKQRFSLRVFADPNILYIQGSGIYLEGEEITTGKAPEFWMGYKFVGWKVDGQWYVGNPVTISMDKNHKAQAIYEEAAEEEIAETTKIVIDSTPRVSNMIVDGMVYLPEELPLTFDWKTDSVHEVGVSDKWAKKSIGTRYEFEIWTDRSNEQFRTVTVEENMTMRALFKTQHYLKVISDYGTVEGAGWFEKGESLEFWVSPIEISDKEREGVRHSFAGWDKGDYLNSSTNAITIEQPTTIIANWEEQYYLDVRSTLPEMQVAGSGWYAAGSEVAIVAEEESQTDPDRKSVFGRWNSIGETPAVISERLSAYATLTMNAPHVVEAEYDKFYYVRIASPYGASSGSNFYKEGEFAELGIKEGTIELNPTKLRALFKKWDLSGADGRMPMINGSANSAQNIVVIVDQPITAVANWRTQYYLDVVTDYGHVSGYGWYDLGDFVNFRVKEPSTPTGLWVRYTFNGWSGDFEGDERQGKVIMNKPKSISAEWNEDYSPAIMNSGIVGGVGAASAVMYRRSKKKNGNGNGNGNGIGNGHGKEKEANKPKAKSKVREEEDVDDGRPSLPTLGETATGAKKKKGFWTRRGLRKPSHTEAGAKKKIGFWPPRGLGRKEGKS